MGGHWLKVEQLSAGDSLTRYNQQKVVIDSITYEKGTFEVFNFEVADYHTYYVSDQHVLAHNDGPCIKFSDLANNGTIDPTQVRFSQNSIKGSFKNGGNLQEFISGLKNGSVDPKDIPAIRIVEKDGLIIL